MQRVLNAEAQAKSATPKLLLPFTGRTLIRRTSRSNSKPKRGAWILAVTGLISLSLAYGQDKPARLAFDVASIRLSQRDAQFSRIKPLPGGDGYTAENATLLSMITTAYRAPARQIVGGPDWIDSAHYEIEAKADHTYGLDDLHEMLRNLLVDRFNLRLHKETREGPVYALMVDKSGVKMKPDGTGQGLKIPIEFGKPGEFIGNRVPIQYLCYWLGQQLQNDGRPVIDNTGLNQSYDFKLSFLPELPPNISRDSLPPEMQNLPSIFDALRQQLGLKLEAKKGPVEYYVIDHVDKPSAN
jgi:uncharacterized protein (TIGR03435 family)